MLLYYLDKVQTSRTFKTLPDQASPTFLTSISITPFCSIILDYCSLFHILIALPQLDAIPFNSLPYFNQNPIYQKPHQMPDSIYLSVPKASWYCFNYHIVHLWYCMLIHQVSFCALWEQRQHLALIPGVWQIADVTKIFTKWINKTCTYLIFNVPISFMKLKEYVIGGIKIKSIKKSPFKNK